MLNVNDTQLHFFENLAMIFNKTNKNI